MPTPIAPRIILAQNARMELHTLARAHTTPQSLALRARMILRAAAVDQPTNLHIGRELGCSNLTVGKWRRRYLALGLPGLQDAPRSGRPRTMSPSVPSTRMSWNTLIADRNPIPPVDLASAPSRWSRISKCAGRKG